MPSANTWSLTPSTATVNDEGAAETVTALSSKILKRQVLVSQSIAEPVPEEKMPGIVPDRLLAESVTS